MKKLFFLLALLVLSLSPLRGQGDFQFGVNAGIPVGDAEDYSNFQLGADVAYLFGIAGVIEVGPLLGYSRFFAEDMETQFGSIEAEDVSFLPIAASGRLGLGLFFLGADLGYALNLDGDGEGGFYYRPKIGVGLVGISIIGSYSGISNNGNSLSSVNLGLEISL